jgi:hypothetical protein
MTLHEHPEAFRDAIVRTAQQFQLPEIYVEKDYWVTLALRQIAHSPLAPITIFKGGTSLSKCHRVIDRFSEDIDLVIYKQAGESANQLNKKLSQLGGIVAAVMPEVELPGVTHKMGNKRKTAHAYPKSFEGDFGQVRPDIILEITYLGNSEPNTTETIQSLIAEMILAGPAQPLIDQFGLQPFEFQVLSMKRTLCEKVISLVRWSHQPDPYLALAAKVRHAYDIHMLLAWPDMRAFLADQAFEDILNRVGQDDAEGLRNDIAWLAAHPKEALLFQDTAATWARIRPTYEGSFKDMLFKTLPPAADVQASLEVVAARLEQLSWHLAQPG